MRLYGASIDQKIYLIGIEFGELSNSVVKYLIALSHLIENTVFQDDVANFANLPILSECYMNKMDIIKAVKNMIFYLFGYEYKYNYDITNTMYT